MNNNGDHSTTVVEQAAHAIGQIVLEQSMNLIGQTIKYKCSSLSGKARQSLFP